LQWAREIQALAQTGRHYSTDEYNRQRYERLLEIAAEIASEAGCLDYDQVYRLFREPIGYATPRVDVRAAAFQGDRLLLVRERMDGGWTMPGGWADVGDVPSEAAEREAFEEAGYRVKARKVIGVYDANRLGPLELFHAFKIVFLCDILEGQPTPSHETSEVAFFGKDEIPTVLSGERTLPRHIADAFRAHEDPSVPTVFD
jgi:ADP-ribose pyrophosphatase YjhB (NUDIX family)